MSLTNQSAMSTPREKQTGAGGAAMKPIFLATVFRSAVVVVHTTSVSIYHVVPPTTHTAAASHNKEPFEHLFFTFWHTQCENSCEFHRPMDEVGVRKANCPSDLVHLRVARFFWRRTVHMLNAQMEHAETSFQLYYWPIGFCSGLRSPIRTRLEIRGSI